ncbi:GNAT family N-acetyltransferase [Sphingobacterium multivorum]|uniref:GNAT family N-acetyltransferase n=1 Tax=Sphingobacterium multivorum TaxID=28454 RepID=UPI00345E6667
MIEIKKANENDAEIISLLGRITYSDTFEVFFNQKKDLLDYLDNTFLVAKIRESLVKDENVYWIASYNKLPMGYVKLKLNSTSEFVDCNKICQLQKIYVLKDFIAAGVGNQLQNIVIEEAKALGYQYIWLSVLDENERAVKFYQKEAYQKIGENTFQIGTQIFNFFTMGKSLN